MHAVPSIPDRGCFGSTVGLDGGALLVHSQPERGRANMTIFVSRDDAATWRVEQKPPSSS